ncbi:MAG: UPF0262 family protein, partial [Hyphomicrobiales bacterium]|nr:UPF0262 family protein [Hyphomicrobiales bacterium]
MEANRTRRLARVTLNETSIGRGTPDQEHEREIAIYDLTESNDFAVPGDESGPYTLDISLQEARLSLAIAREDGTPVVTHLLSLSPFRSIFKDYFLVCESYYAAIRTASPAQ